MWQMESQNLIFNRPPKYQILLSEKIIWIDRTWDFIIKMLIEQLAVYSNTYYLVLLSLETTVLSSFDDETLAQT